MKLPELPPLAPCVDMTYDEIRAYALAYGEMVREECAKVCEQIAAEEEDASPTTILEGERRREHDAAIRENQP